MLSLNEWLQNVKSPSAADEYQIAWTAAAELSARCVEALAVQFPDMPARVFAKLAAENIRKAEVGEPILDVDDDDDDED